MEFDYDPSADDNEHLNTSTEVTEVPSIHTREEVAITKTTDPQSTVTVDRLTDYANPGTDDAKDLFLRFPNHGWGAKNYTTDEYYAAPISSLLADVGEVAFIFEYCRYSVITTTMRLYNYIQSKRLLSLIYK